jgi:hypothetical protein
MTGQAISAANAMAPAIARRCRDSQNCGLNVLGAHRTGHARPVRYRCLTAAAATFITLPLTWREARAAVSRQVG